MRRDPATIVRVVTSRALEYALQARDEFQAVLDHELKLVEFLVNCRNIILSTHMHWTRYLIVVPRPIPPASRRYLILAPRWMPAVCLFHRCLIVVLRLLLAATRRCRIRKKKIGR